MTINETMDPMTITERLAYVSENATHISNDGCGIRTIVSMNENFEWEITNGIFAPTAFTTRKCSQCTPVV